MARQCIIFFFAWGITSLLQAQTITRYNTFSFNVNEGLLQSTITDIAFDKNNFCWLSFPNGIQKFDGKNFISVPVQAGLPDDKLALFYKCDNGDLFISHSSGISRYDAGSNRFILIYTNAAADKIPVRFIGQDGAIVYFYSPDAVIKGMDANTYKITSQVKTGFPGYIFGSPSHPKFSDNIISHKVAMLLNFTLYLWDLRAGKIISKSEQLPDVSPFFLRLKTENEALYTSYKTNDALLVYNFTSQVFSSRPVNEMKGTYMARSTVYAWRNKWLLSLNNRVYETDTSLRELHTEIVNFENMPVAGTEIISQIKEDNFGNLYIVTLRGGIKKIIRNNYPFKYYNTGKIDKNFILSILPDKRLNRVLAGTSENGLLVFDTMQRLVTNIKTLPGGLELSSVNAIIKTPEGSYLLFEPGEKQMVEMSKDFLKFTRHAIHSSIPEEKAGIGYFARVLFKNEKEAVVQSQSNLYKINFSAGTTTEHFIEEGYIMSGLLFKKQIITHNNDELIFLDAASFEEEKRIPFKNTGYVRCYTKDLAGNIYIGCNKGIFKTDSNGKILRHFSKASGLPDECIYAMAFDGEGFLWCSTNKGILKINTDKSFQQFKKEDGLQENEFNTNAVAVAEDGELFFGGVNGVSSFYPSAIKEYEDKIQLLITGIKINNRPAFLDTATWNIDQIELPYDQNSLSFDFIGMGSNSPGQYTYQYKMKGIDREWIQNNDLQTVRYFLPPGNYVFKLYASRFFNKDAKPMKEIRIVINPPYWKTWWFIIATALAIISLLAYIINLNVRRKYYEKLTQLQNEKQLKEERERISKDLHDSLGAYANAVLYNIELLESEKADDKKKNLVADVKFASKDIITSLRETVWALKKESYAAEDCLMRIRNFIQPLSRYYATINFKIDGNVPTGLFLHYTKALNLVRIVQEAVSNSIKHAKPQNINVSTQVIENGWKIVVTDDGNGFENKTQNENDPGNGLSNMKHRAAESGFDFSIETEAQFGTIITIIVLPC